MKKCLIVLPFVTMTVVGCGNSSQIKSPSENNSNYMTPVEQQPNAAIKQGVGAKVTGSAVYQQDKKTHGQGVMQKGLDTWLKEDWEPTFADEDKAGSNGAVENKKDSVEKAASVPETTSSKKGVNKTSTTQSPTTESTAKKSSTTGPAKTGLTSEKQPDHFTLQYYYDRFHKYLTKKQKTK